MTKAASQVEFVNELAMKLKSMDIIHRVTDDVPTPTRRTLPVQGRDLLNFTSCSYLGLETDDRLRQGAMEAISKYGVQFDCSRAYVSLNAYEQLEDLLSQVFGKPVIVTTSVTSGHFSAMPTLVGPNDAMILDHQVHTSVQMAVKMVKSTGTHVEMIRHSRLDYLENRIKKLSQEHDKIWYMADGVYSMHGDIAPMEGLTDLLDRYEQFHLYLDDAHGMSWTGKNGSGAVLSKAPFHPKMILLTSLGKAFGSSGGVAVFPDEKTKNLVRNCGNTLIFTSPLTPPVLGAAIASAKIHLSDDIYEKQRALKERMEYFVQKANTLSLPIISKGESPVFFLGIGKPDVTLQLVQQMMKAGFFMSVAVYPSVPYNQSGLRLMASLYHSFEDIDLLLETLAAEVDSVFQQHNYSLDEVMSAFRLEAAV
jgi:7-keto-8-aminopelargonate synthetase-like enzyme